MENKKELLKIRNLNKTFTLKGNSVVAVDNVSFGVVPGETVGLIGESGSGKTTIGRTIIKLHDATSGQILFDGQDIASKKLNKNQTELLRNNIQMIFQDPYSSLNDQKNIMNIVAEPLKVLKHDQKMIRDLYRNKDEIYSYFPLTMKKEIHDHFSLFRIYANDTAIKFYKIIKNNLDAFKPNKKTKEEDLKALLSIFYDPKFEANNLINDKLLSINDKVLNSWKKMQENVDNKIFEYEEEKNELEAKKAYKKAIKETKHSVNFIKKQKKYNKTLKISETFNDFYKVELYKNKNILKNAISEWTNILSIKKNEMNYSKDPQEHNLFEIEQFLSRKIVYSLKNISKKTKIVSPGFLDQVKDTYDLLRKKSISLFKKSKKDFVVFMQSFNISETIEGLFNNLYKKNVFSISKTKRIVFALFKQENPKMKFETYKELHKTLVKQKRDMIKIKMTEKPSEGAIKRRKESLLEYNKAKETLKIKYEKTQASFDKKLEKDLHKNDAKLEKQNIELETYRKDTKKIFNNLIADIFAQDKKKSIIKIDIKGWTKKQINKKEVENNTLEQSIKRNSKNIRILEKFMTSKKSNILRTSQIKTILVRSRVYQTLVEAGLTKAHAYRYPHEFSGGMRQRVGIARAIISKPRIIIADEPISALDLSIQAQIVNLLKKFQKRDNLSMIFIAHDLSMVNYISDRILIIHLGKIVEYGSTKQIFSKPTHPYTRNLIESMPNIKKISKGFSNTNFSSDYLNKYTVLNVPKYHEVGKGHFVLADSKQIKKWK